MLEKFLGGFLKKMKKRHQTASILLLVFISVCILFNESAFGQEVRIEETTFPQSKKEKKIIVDYKFETVITNSYDAPNFSPLIERSAAITTSSATFNYKGLNFGTKISLAIPTDRNVSDVFSSTELSVAKRFKKTEVKLFGEYFHSEFRRFAYSGAVVSQTYSPNKETRLKLFSNAGYIFPTSTGSRTIRKGFVAKTGGEFESKIGFTTFELTGQFIADSGALHHGRRFGFNGDLTCLVPLPVFGLEVGPRIGFTRLNNENSPSYGFVFRIRK